MKLEQSSPALRLQEYVRCFQQRRASIRAQVVYPIAARPDQFLEFYLQGRYVVRARELGRPEIVPRSVIVGPSTRRRAELVLRGDLEVFTIQFYPAGFHRLFRLPMRELADQAYDARSVLGPRLAEIEQKLADASSFEERTGFASDFLLTRLEERESADAVAVVANRLLRERGALGVGDAAAEAGLGMRQFERRFGELVGLPPKLYARIVRFNAALESKVIAPRLRWTDIAHEFGYFDQMHMIRDFEDFTGESPSTFMRRFEAMPEAWA